MDGRESLAALLVDRGGADYGRFIVLLRAVEVGDLPTLREILPLYGLREGREEVGVRVVDCVSLERHSDVRRALPARRKPSINC